LEKKEVKETELKEKYRSSLVFLVSWIKTSQIREKRKEAKSKKMSFGLKAFILLFFVMIRTLY